MTSLREAVQESLLASAGLAYLALARRPANSTVGAAAFGIANGPLVLASTLVLVVFFATLGRGYSGA